MSQKEKKYKYMLISMVIINIITFTALFSSYDGSYGYNGLMLLAFFNAACLLGIALGALSLLIRLVFMITKKSTIMQTTFLYTFSWILCISVFIIWMVTIMMKMVATRDWFIYSTICGLIGVFILFDIIKFHRIKK